MQDIATLDIEGHGCLEDVLIVYHTGLSLDPHQRGPYTRSNNMRIDCGSKRFDVPRIRSEWVERDPSFKSQVDQMTFGAVQERYGYGSQEDALRSDVKWLKEQPLMRMRDGINFKGYLYDIKSGKLHEVV